MDLSFRGGEPEGSGGGKTRVPRALTAVRPGVLVLASLVEAILMGINPAAALADTAETPVIPTSPECQAKTITRLALSDSWIDEESPLSNKGSDPVLNVEAGSPPNLEGGSRSDRARALVRFGLPGGVPEGCLVDWARLRLFAPEESVGSRADVLRLASSWSEDRVTWSDQPDTTGTAATAWSSDGYIRWTVTSQVLAMLVGPNHGFLIRDRAEGAESGGEHSFHSREKGDSPPELVIRFAPPPSGEPPGPPAPPTPAAAHCGQVLTQSTLVTNDLSNCPGDGLVIGAPRIIIDLDGHTIDGIGLGTGILNEGYASVTVRNGTVREFDYGVQLHPETTLNVVQGLTLQLNELAGLRLFDAPSNVVRSNTVDNNGDGIALVSGTRGTTVVDNVISLSRGWGLVVRDSDANRLERNSVTGGGDLGVGLQRASGNVVLDNAVSGNSDGGIEIRDRSNGNRIEGNQLLDSGDTGILVAESDRNELIYNKAHQMSDSGISLHSANDGVVRGNNLGSNAGGLQMDDSSGNLIEGNDASDTTGIGIELLGGSLENDLLRNRANGNGALGIYLADEAMDGLGNLLLGNTASGNSSDGIAVAKGGHTITANLANHNGGWGIAAAPGIIDGGGNVAMGNGERGQCTGVACAEDLAPPQTTITDRPDDPTTSTSASFRFVGSDDTTPPSALAFECRLEGQDDDFVECSSPQSYVDLGPGPHTFEVRAIDVAGNVDPTPATYTWTVQPAPACTITGTGDAETIIGTSGPDVICGLGGGDVIDGRGGDDVLLGAPGDDWLTGGPGDDTLDGGSGADTAVYASSPAGVTVDLAAGTASGEGSDSLISVQRVNGSTLADYLAGNGENNVLGGKAGNDVVAGRAGNDTVTGAGGNDRLTGGQGNDHLNGGPGNDSLDAGAGTDTCTGGETLVGCEA
jgi:parallel beta-helix repeat protein